MQPLLRHAARSIVDSNRIYRSPRSARKLSSEYLYRTSTCARCQLRLQRRHFADDSKPKPLQVPLQPTLSSNDGFLSSSSFSSNPELPSASDSRRSATSKRMSDLMDHLQGNIFLASQRLNDLTGYSGIEALKTAIRDLEAHLANCQDGVRTARQTYKQTVADRAASQREVTTLLARKDTWTPTDLERFTSLYRSDHGNEHAVQEAAVRLADAERAAEQAANKLSTSILSRYHEEQIWSDKIRRMSTWGTWGLMGVNVFIFLVFQFGFEPWRRRRLVKGFEEKVQEALQREKEKQALASGGRRIDGKGALDEAHLNDIVAASVEELVSEAEGSGKSQKPASDAIAAAISEDVKVEGAETETVTGMDSSSGLDHLRLQSTWKAGVLDLFSDRMVSLKKQDITKVALEGVASGAALASFFMFIFRPN